MIQAPTAFANLPVRSGRRGDTASCCGELGPSARRAGRRPPGLQNGKGTDLSIRPLPAYELLLALALGNQCADEFCETTSLSLKMGRNIAITIPPTMIPRK